MGDVAVGLRAAGEVAQDLVVDVLEVFMVDRDLAVLQVFKDACGGKRRRRGERAS